MEKTIYDQLGGFAEVRKLITEFYNKVLDEDELSVLFKNSNMERIIDHQTKFFAMLLGGPASFSDDEIQKMHQHLSISPAQFDLTKACLEETLEDFELSEEHILYIADSFESKRSLVVLNN